MLSEFIENRRLTGCADTAIGLGRSGGFRGTLNKPAASSDAIATVIIALLTEAKAGSNCRGGDLGRASAVPAGCIMAKRLRMCTLQGITFLTAFENLTAFNEDCRPGLHRLGTSEAPTRAFTAGSESLSSTSRLSPLVSDSRPHRFTLVRIS